MSNDLELHEYLLLSDPAVSDGTDVAATDVPTADSKTEKRRPGFSVSDHVATLNGDGNGGLICVMFCLVLFLLVLMFLFFYAVTIAYASISYINELFYILTQTRMDFSVTPTVNIDHYNGILLAGGPPTDYLCHFQGDALLADCTNEDEDHATIQFDENGPKYFFFPNQQMLMSSKNVLDSTRLMKDNQAVQSLVEMKLPHWMLASRLEEYNRILNHESYRMPASPTISQHKEHN